MELDGVLFISGFVAEAYFFFASMVVGFTFLLFIFETLYRFKGDLVYAEATETMAKSLFLFFSFSLAFGAFSLFGLIVVWPVLTKLIGMVLFYPLYVGVFLFPIESIFLVMYWFTWGELKGSKLHIAMSFVLLICSVSLVALMTSVNSFMHTPAGVRFVNGRVEADLWAAFLNPGALVSVLHVVPACFASTSFLCSGVYAFKALRGGEKGRYTRVYKVLILISFTLMIVQVGTGQLLIRTVARFNPEKFAAIKGVWETGSQGIISFLVYGDWDKPILGLKDFPPKNRPPQFLHHVFYLKLILTGYLLVLGLAASLFVLRRGNVPITLLKSSIPTVFAAPIVQSLGWFVREVGRKPWTVYKLLKVEEAMSVTFKLSNSVISLLVVILSASILAFFYAVYRVLIEG